MPKHLAISSYIADDLVCIMCCNEQTLYKKFTFTVNTMRSENYVLKKTTQLCNGEYRVQFIIQCGAIITRSIFSKIITIDTP